ncbi:MAG: GerMN domain-containing protein [Treponema sp.]|nr:GerMN domain-containing protein [Treponema sp.]
MAQQRKKKRTKQQNNGFLIAAVWMLCAIVIFMIFLIKRETIAHNLSQTNFFARVFGPTASEESTSAPDISEMTSAPLVIDIVPPVDTTETIVADIAEHEQKPPETITPVIEQRPLPPKTSEQKSVNTSKETVAVPPEQKPAAATMNTQLCFVVIEPEDGSINRHIVTRTLPKSDSPLSDTLKSLFTGPTAAEQTAHYLTLIPPGTRLLGVTIRDGIAIVNVSDEFEINPYGVEGYIAQLMQVVYTATTFPTVQGVQFIINGERKEFLGGDGQWIGSPLSRASFK